jgi:uncharacterized protein (DUF952 family)
MNKLYRVIDRYSWVKAKELGYVPRCAADQHDDYVNLNLLDEAEVVASTYFDPEEEPITLEVDISDFSEKITWTEPTEIKPWKQACAKIQNIPTRAVTKIYEFGCQQTRQQNVFKLMIK